MSKYQVKSRNPPPPTNKINSITKIVKTPKIDMSEEFFPSLSSSQIKIPQPHTQINFKEKLQKIQEDESKDSNKNELPLGWIILDRNYRPKKRIAKEEEEPKEDPPVKIDLSNFVKMCMKRRENYIQLYGEDNYNKIFRTKNYRYHIDKVFDLTDTDEEDSINIENSEENDEISSVE